MQDSAESTQYASSRRHHRKSKSQTPGNSQEDSLESDKSQSLETSQQVNCVSSQSSGLSGDSRKKNESKRKSSRRRSRSRSRRKSRSKSRDGSSRVVRSSSRSRGGRSTSRSKKVSRSPDKKKDSRSKSNAGNRDDDVKRRRESHGKDPRDRSDRPRTRSSRHHSKRSKTRSRSRKVSRVRVRRTRSRSASSYEKHKHSSKVRRSRSRSRSKDRSSNHQKKNSHTSGGSVTSSSSVERVSPRQTSTKHQQDSSENNAEGTSKSTNKTRIIAAINVSLEATKHQLAELFGFCGRVKDIAVYPPVQNMPFSSTVPYRICLVKFAHSSSSGIALHLTGTAFLDKTLMVVPCVLTDIPDDEEVVWDAVCVGIKQLTTSEPAAAGTPGESDKENENRPDNATLQIEPETTDQHETGNQVDSDPSENCENDGDVSTDITDNAITITNPDSEKIVVKTEEADEENDAPILDDTANNQ